MQLNKLFVNKAITEIVVIAFASLIISLQYFFASGGDLFAIQFLPLVKLMINLVY